MAAWHHTAVLDRCCTVVAVFGRWDLHYSLLPSPPALLLRDTPFCSAYSWAACSLAWSPCRQGSGAQGEGMGLGGRRMQGPAATRAVHRSCLHPASRSVSQPPRQSATRPASQATHPPTPPPSQPAIHPGTQPTHPPLQSLACIHAKRRSSHQRSARLQGGTGREHQQGGRTETRLRSGGSGPGGGPGTRRHSWPAGWLGERCVPYPARGRRGACSPGWNRECSRLGEVVVRGGQPHHSRTLDRFHRPRSGGIHCMVAPAPIRLPWPPGRRAAARQ